MRFPTILLLLSVLHFCNPCARAAEGGGSASWNEKSKIEYTRGFLFRMVKELAVRWENLRITGHVTEATGTPFTKDLISGETKESKEFLAADMGMIASAKVVEKALSELEANRKLVARHEKKASDAREKALGRGKTRTELPPEKSAFLYDMQVQAGRLGVILDNSPSMSKHLPALREKISSEFPGALFVEVDGCELGRDRPTWGAYPEWYYSSLPPLTDANNPFDKKYYLPEIPRKEIHNHAVSWTYNAPGAFRGLVNLMDVDAIYWFCDFDDPVTNSAVQSLDKLLTKNRKVRLYVHTVKFPPPGSITGLIRRTNGKLTQAVPVARTPDEIKALPAVPLTGFDFANSLNLPVKIEAVISSARWQEEGEKVWITPEAEAAAPGFFLGGYDWRSDISSDADAEKQYPKGRKVTAYGILRKSWNDILYLDVEDFAYLQLSPE